MRPKTPPTAALPLACAAALSLLPLVGARGLASRWLGSPTPDLYDHVFLFQWFAGGLRHGQGLVTQTTLLGGPGGGVIAMPDPLGGLSFALLHLVLPAPLAFNVALALAIAAGGAAAAWLAGVAGAEGPGRVAAGALYAGSSYTWAQVHNGETETLQLFALPLALGALVLAHRALVGEGGRCARVAATRAGLAVGLSFLASWYYGAYAVLIACVGLAWAALGRLAAGDRRGLAHLALGAGVAAAIILPQALSLKAALAAGDSLFRMPDVLEVLRSDYLALGASSADVTGLVSPGALSAAVGYLHGGYLGAAVLALGAACLAAAPARARPWAGLGGAFFILALGPHLYAGGEPVGLPGSPVELPYLTLSQVVPFFGSMRLPYRCLVLVHLGLAVTVGVGLGALIPLKGRGAWAAAVGIVALFYADGALFSGLPFAPETVDVPRHPAAGLVEAGGMGVLDVPVRFEGRLARGLYVAQQGDHGGWLPYSLMSSGMSRAVALNPLVVALAAADPEHRARPLVARSGTTPAALGAAVEAALFEAPPPAEALAQGRRALEAEGIRWIVVHREALAPDAADAFEALLSAQLGPPARATDEVLIYGL